MASGNSTTIDLWSSTTKQIQDVLACSSCRVIPYLPIHMCEAQGHPYCSLCARKASFTCTKLSGNLNGNSCGSEIRLHKCRLVETLFLQSEVRCSNAENGCTELIKGQEIEAHRDICPFKKYDCPFQLKCATPILRRNFVPHFLDTHQIPMISIYSDQLLKHNISFPTRITGENEVVWVERIVEVQRTDQTLFFFMNCKYDFNETKLIMWITEFDDIKAEKIKLILSFVDYRGNIAKRLRGATCPLACELKKLLRDNQAFSVRNAATLLGGTHDMNFWRIQLRFIFKSIHSDLVPDLSE